MGFIFPNQGDTWLLSGALMRATSYKLGLFASAQTLSATLTTALANMTALNASGGYAPFTVYTSAWCVPFLSAGSAVSSAVGATAAAGFQFTFSAAPNQSAYGYYITPPTGELLLAETFSDGPYYLSNAGDTVTVLPYVKGS